MVDAFNVIVANFDLIAYGGLIAIWIYMWMDSTASEEIAVEERNLGASVVGSYTSAALTATSILIPAAFVIIQLSLGSPVLPKIVIVQVVRSLYWFILSIGLGIFNSARLSNLVGRQNIAKDSKTNIIGAAQLFAILFGVLRMGVGVWLIGLNG